MSGASHTSTTEPASTDAGTSTALCSTTVVVAAAAAAPTALCGHEFSLGDRARRDEPGLERLGREVGALQLPERDVDETEVVVGDRLAGDDRARRREHRHRLPRGGDDEPDADDGCRDEQDAEEEACVAPEGAGTRACGLDCRHATIVAQPLEIGPRDYPQAASCRPLPPVRRG